MGMVYRSLADNICCLSSDIQYILDSDSNQENERNENEEAGEYKEQETNSDISGQLQTIIEQNQNIIEYHEKEYNAIMCIILVIVLTCVGSIFFKNIMNWLNGV